MMIRANSLVHQWAPGSTETGSRKKLVVNTTIPPLGYRQLRLMDGDSQQVKVSARAEENNLENEFLKVHISANGTLSIFRTKKTEKNCFPEEKPDAKQ